MQKHQIFQPNSAASFLKTCLSVFAYQYQHIPVYRTFCDLLQRNPSNVHKLSDIPFLPISFFKTKEIKPSSAPSEIVFTSSGTTGSQTSKHMVTDLSWYHESYLKAFQHFYGNISDYAILALLPSYLERSGSSLIYMAEDLIKRSTNKHSGFFLNQWATLHQTLQELEAKKQKTLLIGVSFALLDFVDQFPMQLQHTTIMETGGMKGRKKEITRQELHQILSKGFGVEKIHSEYGMTELLSQAYSQGDGKFYTPGWMKILIRDPEDPFHYLEHSKTGGLNIIDLANINSCAFIATQDLGKINADNSFEILGRFDHSDIRGCNLMAL